MIMTEYNAYGPLDPANALCDLTPRAFLHAWQQHGRSITVTRIPKNAHQYNEDMYNVAIVGGIYPGLVTQSLVKECDSNALEWLRSQNMNKKLELLLL